MLQIGNTSCPKRVGIEFRVLHIFNLYERQYSCIIFSQYITTVETRLTVTRFTISFCYPSSVTVKKKLMMRPR